MRKSTSQSKIGRNKSQREALVKSQVKDLILHGYIRTTLNRAKLVKAQFDKLADDILKGREKKLQTYLINSEYIKKLKLHIKEERKTGYTTFIRIDNRKGDRAERVLLEILK